MTGTAIVPKAPLRHLPLDAGGWEGVPPAAQSWPIGPRPPVPSRYCIALFTEADIIAP